MLYDFGMVDLTRLRTFRTVVAAGSVAGAAENLGYTPSAVSQQIHALQKDIGLTLFERAGRGVAPTAIGRQIAREAETLLTQAGRLDTLAADLRDGRTGAVSISHISSVGAAWMPAVVATLAREFPELRLDLRLWEVTQGRGDEPDVEINLAVPPNGSGMGPGASGREYIVEDLLTEPFVVVLPAGHPLAGRSQVALQELIGQTWIDNDVAKGSCRQIVVDACAAQGFIPNFQVQTHEEATAVAFVEAGVGLTIMPALSLIGARPDPAKVKVVPVMSPVLQRTIVVRAKQALVHSPPVRRVLELLREQAGRSRGPDALFWTA